MPIRSEGGYLAILCTVGVVAAASMAPGAAEAADRYEIDPAHTHVQFSVRRFGFNDVIGSFPDVKGVITLDPDAPEKSHVEAEIGVASLVSGDETRDGHLLGPAWFQAKEFGTISFRSNSVEQDSDNHARITGDLTLHGVTRPVTLDVTLNKIGVDPATKRQAAGVSAVAVLNRSEFGMETAANFVGAEVAIRIETLAHRIEE